MVLRLILPLILLPLLAAQQFQAPVSAGFLHFPADEEIGAMSGVAVSPKGPIYVLHRGPKPLMVFDAKGNHVRSFGAGMFKVAHGLRVDPDGNIWTTDNALSLIRNFSPSGDLLLTLGEDGKTFHSPDDLVFTSKGEIIVADAGSARLVRLSPEGKVLTAWGKKGKGPGEFAAAHGLAIDKQDRIFVADRGNNRIQIFSVNGDVLGEWNGFGNPFGLLVMGPQLLVSDGDANRITHFRLADGTIAGQWGDAETLKLPHLMSYDARGRLYIAEVNGKRVQIFQTPKSE